MKVEGVVMDLDGTVLDSMHVWSDIDKEFLGRRGHNVPEDYIECITALGFHKAADYTIERFGLQERPEDILQEWHDMAVEAYRHQVGLKPGAGEYIRKLHKKGIKISGATSGEDSLFLPALERNEILSCFSEIVQTREVARGKEFPDVYEEAARRIQIPVERCMVFEDILKGVKGAKQGGFYTIGVYDVVSAHEMEQIKKLADRFIYDYNEIMELNA